MEIAVWPVDFKIRTLADAKRFVCMCDERGFGKSKGDIYWSAGDFDYCLDVAAKRVSFRNKSERGNIFSPYIDSGFPSCIKDVYRMRKYINKQVLG